MAVKLKITQKAIIMVAVPLVLELGFILGLAELLNRAQAAQQQEYMAKQAVADANELLELSFNQGFALFRYSFTHASSDANHYNRLANRFEQILYDLELRTLHDDKQFTRVRRLRHAAAAITAKLEGQMDALAERRALPSMKLTEIRHELEPLSRSLIDTVHEFTEAENLNKRSNPESEAFYSELVNRSLFAGVILNLIVASALTGYFNQSISSRLSLLMDNIVRLSKRKELNPPVPGTDEIARLDAVFREMADALAMASARERAILANAADVIFSTNENLAITAVSDAAQTELGFDPAALISKSVDAFIVPEEMDKVRTKFKEIQKEGDMPPFETIAMRADGSTIDVTLSVRWSGKERAFFCVAHNISTQKELQRIKQEFYAMVSHDLRSPLTSLQIFLEIMTKGVYGHLSPEGNRRANQQLSEIGRLVNMINSLLDMEKADAGKLDLAKEEIRLDTVIEKSVSALSISAERAKLKVEWEPSTKVIFADEDRIVQVLVNFLSNAIKYSPTGGEIRIESIETNEWVEVRVIDQGCGIAAELQGTIFEKFEQVKNKSAKRANSTGLGLTISRKLIEEHGGSVGVNSLEGEGSTFWFRLPTESTLKQSESGDVANA